MMKLSSILYHLLCDDNSLSSYFEGKEVSYDEVKRHLFLLQRLENSNIPDHYHKLNKKHSLQDINSLTDIITKGLPRIANDHLELKNKKIYVKADKQNEWQELITKIPPLVLLSALLATKKRIDIHSEKSIINFYEEYIIPNICHTALPYPFLPQIELYCKENNGFHDLHMHLNGSTETDVAWQDFLYDTESIYKELEKGFTNPMVKEQFEQESHLLNPLKFNTLLKSSRRLRYYFSFFLYPSTSPQVNYNNAHHLLMDIQLESSQLSDSIYHPFYSIIYKNFEESGYNRSKLLSIEALMYTLLFNYLSSNPNESLASAFHYYLLILGLSNRLLVQQTHQNGFVQFQKHTVNELRSESERTYKNRFFQLMGNDLRNINFLEGRFAPKNSLKKTTDLISRIDAGWEALLKDIHPDKKLNPELQLTAHFIKRKDNQPDEEIRHKELRYNIWNQGLVLAYMKKNEYSQIRKVIGIDAAACEFDTPPEVFAPTFRMLRRNSFKHFTYHAGEDFFHIIGGLRAIYEAVTFCELQTGDRIGHATASGLSPYLWKQNIGEQMLITQGEYLDDLVFSYHLIISENIVELKNRLPFLIHTIQEYTNRIYKKNYSLKSIEDAWLLRKFCPVTIRALSINPRKDDAWSIFNKGNPIERAEEYLTFDFEEWSNMNHEISINPHEEKTELLLKYHNLYYRNAYNKIVKIETEDIFSLEDIKILQLKLLHFLHKQEIIIETLPTSNVRIGHHYSFKTYHLKNWLQWEEEGHYIPPIIVGTDDTGIFATNIYNEFANIYCFLTNSCNYTHAKAMSVIEKLERNAKIYRFDS